MTDDMDARARVKRLEAENARLRADAFTLSLRELQHGLNCLSVDNAMDRPDFQLAWDIYEAAKQCATPPPESEPDDRVMDNRGRMWPTHGACLHCGGMGEMHGPGEGDGECPKCNGTGNAPHTPEQTSYEDHVPSTHPQGDRMGSWPEQAHGDALAAFEEVMADFHELTGIDPNANPKVGQVRQALTVCREDKARESPTNDEAQYHLDFLLRSSNADHQSLRKCDEVIRRHLTASGVPEDNND